MMGELLDLAYGILTKIQLELAEERSLRLAAEAALAKATGNTTTNIEHSQEEN